MSHTMRALAALAALTLAAAGCGDDEAADTTVAVAGAETTAAAAVIEDAPCALSGTVVENITVDGATYDAATQSVTVPAATMPAGGGFLVVHLGEGGGPGTVLSSAPPALAAGPAQEVVVPLDAPLAGPTELWPMVHCDTGSDGVYAFTGQDGSLDPPAGADDGVVMMPVTLG